MELSLDRLYRRMEMEGVTAAQLAERVGISRQGMYNIINGKSQPRPATLEGICNALHCTRDMLIGRDERALDHTLFADALLARYWREHSYDVEAAILDYIQNWLAERYNDLSKDEFEAVRADALEQSTSFAQNMDDLLKRCGWLTISESTQRQAAHEAFNLFFDVLPCLIEDEIGCDNPDFDLFEGMPEE